MGASVVAGCNTTPVFELGKQVFHLVPGFVRHLTIIDCFLSVFLRRYARRDLLFGKHGSDFIAVITSIPDQGFGFRQVLEQDIRALEVTALAFRQV